MSYLESFVPNGTQKQRQIIASWKGLDEKHRTDTDTLTGALNVSYENYPAIKPAKANRIMFTTVSNVLSCDYVGMDKYDNEQLCEVIYVSASQLRIRVIDIDGTEIFNGTISDSASWTWKTGFSSNDKPVAIPFNVYTSTGYDIISATYKRNILIFPYGLRINIDDTTPSITVWNTEDNPCPTPSLVAVHQGRVWGAKDGKIFASEWNNFANWLPPTATDIENGDVSHFPWVSATQSSIEASEDFTAIYSYDGHIVAFKENFMHQIYNTKNPFRIVDVCRIGCNSQSCITECNKVLYFACGGDIYAYTGGYPEKISESLNIGYVYNLSSGSRYVYATGEAQTLYVYDTESGFWSNRNDTAAGYPWMFVKMQGSCIQYSGTKVSKINAGTTLLAATLMTSFFAKGEISEKRINKVRLLADIGGGGGSVKIYSTNRYDKSMAEVPTKLLKSFTSDTYGTHALTVLTRTTANYGFRIMVQFENATVSYLQIDYERIGELNA